MSGAKPWDADPGRESLPLAWTSLTYSPADERTRQRLALMLECERCAALTLAAWKNGLSATVRCRDECWRENPPARPSGALRRALSASHAVPEPSDQDHAA